MITDSLLSIFIMAVGINAYIFRIDMQQIGFIVLRISVRQFFVGWTFVFVGVSDIKSLISADWSHTDTNIQKCSVSSFGYSFFLFVSPLSGAMRCDAYICVLIIFGESLFYLDTMRFFLCVGFLFPSSRFQWYAIWEMFCDAINIIKKERTLYIYPLR